MIKPASQGKENSVSLSPKPTHLIFQVSQSNSKIIQNTDMTLTFKFQPKTGFWDFLDEKTLSPDQL